MKKTILTLSLVFLAMSFSPIIAQEVVDGQVVKSKKEKLQEMTPEERARKKTDKMKKELNLSAEQEAELYAINLKHAKERAALQQERAALKAKYKQAKADHSEAVNAVLTPEQIEKLEALKKEKKEKAKARRAEMVPPPPPAPPRP